MGEEWLCALMNEILYIIHGTYHSIYHSVHVSTIMYMYVHYLLPSSLLVLISSF